MSSVHLEPDQLPDAAPHNHGKTVAAWVTNAGITLGVLVAGVGFMLPVAAVIWAGVGVIGASLIAGGVLRAMGHGQPLS